LPISTRLRQDLDRDSLGWIRVGCTTSNRCPLAVYVRLTLGLRLYSSRSVSTINQLLFYCACVHIIFIRQNLATNFNQQIFLKMRFCVILACSTSPSSSVNEDWVSLVTSPDFEVMHRQTRSSESVPRRGIVTVLRRSEDAPAVVHSPPGSTRSVVTRVLQRRRPWS